MCIYCNTFKKIHPNILDKLGINNKERLIITSLTNAWEIANIALGKVNDDNEYRKRKDLWDNEEIVYGSAIDVPDDYSKTYQFFNINGISMFYEDATTSV